MMRSLERMSERVVAGTIRLGTKLARLSETLAARPGTSAQWVPSELARKDSPDESEASMRLDSGSKPNRWFTNGSRTAIHDQARNAFMSLLERGLESDYRGLNKIHARRIDTLKRIHWGIQRRALNLMEHFTSGL